MKTNKYGMPEIECRRGTNGTEAVHRKLHYTFAGWQTGPRMADALLAEFRHRHNIVCAELRWIFVVGFFYDRVIVQCLSIILSILEMNVPSNIIVIVLGKST